MYTGIGLALFTGTLSSQSATGSSKLFDKLI